MSLADLYDPWLFRMHVYCMLWAQDKVIFFSLSETMLNGYIGHINKEHDWEQCGKWCITYPFRLWGLEIRQEHSDKRECLKRIGSPCWEASGLIKPKIRAVMIYSALKLPMRHKWWNISWDTAHVLQPQTGQSTTAQSRVSTPSHLQ